MDFTIESYYNPYLATGQSRLDAIVSVAAVSGGGLVQVFPKRKAVAYLIDVSASMYDDRRLETAKDALRRVIGLLTDECWFAVISFSDDAAVVVPMSPATTASREAAIERVGELEAYGATYMSRALMAALGEFSRAGDAIRYAQFLTDGDNSRRDSAALDHALGQCRDHFTCDCWGIGTRWKPDELRRIAGALLGTASAVPDPGRLEQEFGESLSRVLSKTVGDVRLRLEIPHTCRVVSVKQTSPEITDLTPVSQRRGDKYLDVPTGAWGDDESRDYHLVFELEPRGVGEEVPVCRPSVVYTRDGNDLVITGQGVVAVWTADGGLSAETDARVAHYTGQEEIADSIREGLAAKSRGDKERAATAFGRAAKLASESGNEVVTARIEKVVDVVDAAAGTVRLRPGSRAAELALDLGGTRTVQCPPYSTSGQRLEQWRARLATVSRNLMDLSGAEPTKIIRARLSDPARGYSGVTLERVSQAVDALDGLLEQYALVADVVNEASRLAGKGGVLRGTNGDRARALLEGRSVLLAARYVPVGARGLLDDAGRELRSTPAEVLAAMERSFADARDAISAFAVAEAGIRQTLQEIAALSERADTIGAVGTAPSEIDGWLARAESDPLGCAAELDGIERAVSRWRAELQVIDADRKSVLAAIERGRACVAELRDLEAQSGAAFIEARRRIVNPEGLVPPSRSGAAEFLGTWLETLEQSAAAGRFTDAKAGMARWERECDDRLAAERAGYARNRAAVDEVADLAGRFAALRAKADTLRTRGLVLGEAADAVRHQAETVLDAVPLDVRTARYLVGAFEAAVAAAARS